ncbi:MFS transporter [Streptomyces sp. VRA16 Mangrove soil]|uniref:MFS transporter n=1 Tax=Streptomyces sp. VRA16 Mangrove soil TaxID=2817434 RepID=UPI001A9D69D7|nr:MFS transporter [Streptomyces sp. VRA16 Mangrove soil]MBO1332833.1 MFS transporter [Streptomyces sp. VRA16 Mangrove soil]
MASGMVVERAEQRGPDGARRAVAADRAPGPVYAVLAALAAVYVVGPVLRAAARPTLVSDLGIGRESLAASEVLGAVGGIVALFVTGRAGDRLGRRRVLIWSLAAFGAGSLFVACVAQPAVYVAGRVLVTMAASAVFVTCLAYLPSLSLPGRLRRIIGTWLAVMSLTFFAAVNAAASIVSALGWRTVSLLFAAFAVAGVLAVRRIVPETPVAGASTCLDVVFSGCLGAAALLTAGLHLAPARGWTDPLVLALLGATAAAAALGLLCSRRRRRIATAGSLRQPGTALAAGVVVGFTQIVVALTLPALVIAGGGTPTQGVLAVSAFGLGGAAACLLARRTLFTPLTGCSLGLPLAAVGLALLHGVPMGAGAATLMCCAMSALIGFGVMLAQAPQMAGFLAALPHSRLGAFSALHPTAVILGTAAAQAMPATSVLHAGTLPLDTGELLWVAVAVVAVAALAVGRPAVAAAVAGVAALEYLLIRGFAGPQVAQRPGTVVTVLALGTLAGVLTFLRRQQTERHTRTQQAAGALQHAVLHPIPARLGRLRLAGLYRPATAGTGIGGDFLEAVDTPYGTRILVGDVRGKGMQAVQTVTDVLGAFRSQAHEVADLGELAARLDRQLVRAAAARGDEELFATALLFQHGPDGDTVDLVNCGHLAPLAVSARSVREIAVPALLPLGFGVLGDDRPRPDTVRLAPDETLLLHTDGLSEARNSSGEFYPLAQRLEGAAGAEPGALVSHLDRDVHDWTHHLADDIAVLALTRETATVPRGRDADLSPV